MASRSPHLQREFVLLFLVMLTVATGNTALQSVLPAIGRSLKLPDSGIALAFSVSGLLWVVVAPYWANRLERFGARRMLLLGLGGFTASLLLCAIALSAGIMGLIAPFAALSAFVLARMIYGGLGSAAPPAAQAMVAVRTSREERTKALTLLASAFGLGTILGPALSPFMVIPGAGLAGPAYIFALTGLVVAIFAARILPRHEPAGAVLQGAAVSYPSVGGQGTGATITAATAPHDAVVRWADLRIRPWIVIGIIMGHAQAIAGQVMGFLIIDRLNLPLDQAQQAIGLVLMMGAGAALLAQWGIIPLLGMGPRGLVLSGGIASALGCVAIATTSSLHGLATAYALASLGFGFVRPGYTAGASLAVGRKAQGSVAGKVTSVNGGAFILGPTIGIGLYEIWRPLPYYASAVAMVGMLAYTLWQLRRQASR